MSAATIGLPSGGLDAIYRQDCRRCPRLAAFLDEVQVAHPAYFCRPVPPFGDSSARLLVVGLAPGLHGANATGRPFTGDACSDLLYGSLHAAGFASAAQSLSTDDGLVLKDCRITNAVKCLPPQNKPTPAEATACRPYLAAELRQHRPRVVLCLGAVAHDSVLRSLPLDDWSVRRKDLPFGHARLHELPGLMLLDSYHPSRYNINTGRLTEAMFRSVVGQARALLDRRAEA